MKTMAVDGHAAPHEDFTFERGLVFPEMVKLMFRLPDGLDIDNWEVDDYERATQAVMGLNFEPASSLPCGTHSQPCTYNLHGNDKRALTLHIAGSPCQDWSAIGRRKQLQGGTLRAFMGWIVLMHILSPLIIVHENVTQFPLGLLKFLLGSLYNISSSTIAPSHVSGFPVRRDRTYGILTLRSKLALSLPLSDLHNAHMNTHVDRMSGEALYCAGVPEGHQFTLTQQASGWLRVYSDKHPDRTIFDLSQASSLWQASLAVKHSPPPAGTHGLAQCTHTSYLPCVNVVAWPQNPLLFNRKQDSMGLCPTITRGSRRLWCTRFHRWLLPCERILAQSIPITSWAASKMAITRRTFCDPGAGLSDGALGSFAGNAMHAACVGSAVLWALGASVRTTAVAGSTA